MLFDFFQGGGVLMPFDKGRNEIEDLLLSLGEHRVEFRFTFDNNVFVEQSQQKDAEGARPQKSTFPTG